MSGGRERGFRTSGVRTWIGWIWIGCGVVWAAVAAPEDATGRGDLPPNIVLILADDLGYGDLPCYDPSSPQVAPNLERLAAEGMRFTDFYVSSPVCSPSRASILSGCYHRRIGVNHVLWPVSVIGLNPAETTLAEVLKRRGYATLYLGKWHVGDQPEFLPTRQGFDSYFGIPYSHDMPSLLQVRRTEETFLPLKVKALPLYRDEKPVALVTGVRKLTRRYRDEAVAWIAAQHEAGRPFFLFLGHHAVHLPMKPSKEYRGESGNGAYGDWLTEMDAGVGALLALVAELGIDERTIFLFLSDNGPAKGARGSAGPLRGGKRSALEGGLRVPLLVRWPGQVAPGSVCRELAAGMDLLPTLAALAGAPIPGGRLDGVDLSGLLLGNGGGEAPRRDFFYYDGGRLAAVRKGTWKLHLGVAGGGRSLYDLASDPGETNDLGDERPEVVAELMALAEEAKRRYGDGLKTGELEREPGKVGRLRPVVRALPLFRGEGDPVESDFGEGMEELEGIEVTDAKDSG
jgi:arylsulfatase A-like enzyme